VLVLGFSLNGSLMRLVCEFEVGWSGLFHCW